MSKNPKKDHDQPSLRFSILVVLSLILILCVAGTIILAAQGQTIPEVLIFAVKEIIPVLIKTFLLATVSS